MPMSSERFNLQVIDQAYGPYADLYVDVLRVSYLASDEEIQTAFFDRRSEVFAILSKLNSDDETGNGEIALSQRRFAERRMDAVVMAFRILKRPESRKAYEKERERRIACRVAPSSSKKGEKSAIEIVESPRGVNSFDELIRPVPFDECNPRNGRYGSRGAHQIQESHPINHSKLRTRLASPPPSRQSREIPNRPDDYPVRNLAPLSSQDSSWDDREERSDRETSSHHGSEGPAPRRRRKNEGVVEKSSGSLARAIVEEVHGAYIDTITAFDQVFNAFTLQEQDIQAVCGRIELAKKQLIPR